MNVTTFGLDIAKNVMQVHWVDGQTGEVGLRALKRAQLAPFFARQVQCRIVLEACGSGHYWARTLSALGHEVRLIHARHVRPFVRGNKNDAADAQAICSAAQQPDMRWVLRTLLMHGARAVIFHAKVKSVWLEKLLARRPLNVVVAALANKMARTAWALVAHGREYQAGGFAQAGLPKT